MERINRINVSLDLEGNTFEVGELVMDQRKIYFQYARDFLNQGIHISPLKMPLSSAILRPDTAIFDGLFGVFSDTLPDGWGRLLLDRTLLSRQIDLDKITPLDRLAYVGSQGMGALIYEPAFANEPNHQILSELDAIAKSMQQVLSGASTHMIEELFQIGGSSGGARPKMLVGYNPLTDQLMHDVDPLPAGYEHWMIKFSATVDLDDMAQIEYAYYKMALDAGLDMNPCRLFQGASGKYYFGTKRFDRQENKRLHLHSAAGLMHDNFRLSNMDYGHLMDAAFRLEKNIHAYQSVLRLAAFNIYAHNRDDHSKNVSFLMNAKGSWKLAPAYDLTFSRSSHGYHSMTIAGEGQSPGRAQLLELAKVFGVEHVDILIEQVKDTISQWKQYAQSCGVSNASVKLISDTLNSRLRN